MLFFLVCHKGLTIINNKNKNNKMYIWFLYASFLTRLRFFFFKLLLCFQKFFFFYTFTFQSIFVDSRKLFYFHLCLHSIFILRLSLVTVCCFFFATTKKFFLDSVWYQLRSKQKGKKKSFFGVFHLPIQPMAQYFLYYHLPPFLCHYSVALRLRTQQNHVR